MDTIPHCLGIILTEYPALLLVRTYTLWGRNKVLFVALLLLALVNPCPQLAIAISVKTFCRAASQDLGWSVPALYPCSNVRFITTLLGLPLVWCGYHVDQDPPLITSGCYQTQRIAIYAINYALLALFEMGHFFSCCRYTKSDPTHSYTIPQCFSSLASPTTTREPSRYASLLGWYNLCSVYTR